MLSSACQPAVLGPLQRCHGLCRHRREMQAGDACTTHSLFPGRQRPATTHTHTQHALPCQARQSGRAASLPWRAAAGHATTHTPLQRPTSSICSSVRKSQKPSIMSTASLVPATTRSRLLSSCSATVGLITKPRPGSSPTRTPATALRSGTSATAAGGGREGVGCEDGRAAGGGLLAHAVFAPAAWQADRQGGGEDFFGVTLGGRACCRSTARQQLQLGPHLRWPAQRPRR